MARIGHRWNKAANVVESPETNGSQRKVEGWHILLRSSSWETLGGTIHYGTLNCIRYPSIKGWSPKRASVIVWMQHDPQRSIVYAMLGRPQNCDWPCCLTFKALRDIFPYFTLKIRRSLEIKRSQAEFKEMSSCTEIFH